MDARVLVLGAGFGGLELSATLSEALGERVELTLVDRSDAFVFGGSKLDILFGRCAPETVRLPYRTLAKPGVRFRNETVTSIDPVARRVTTEAGVLEADVLVVALGADYDLDATPGLDRDGHPFYSVAGATEAAQALARFDHGHVVIGAASSLYKCPPAPSETALLLHEHLVERGIRERCEVSLVLPFELPLPPSHATSEALLAAFDAAGIRYVPERVVRALDPGRHTAVLSDASELAYDLFLGVPKHRVPEVVARSGMVEDGWIPVDRKTLATCYPGVYAIGDVANVGTPKAGVFAEGTARTVAAAILADFTGGTRPDDYEGTGACYVDFGGGRVGRVELAASHGLHSKATYLEPSPEIARHRQEFARSRRARWFGV